MYDKKKKALRVMSHTPVRELNFSIRALAALLVNNCTGFALKTKLKKEASNL